MAVSALTALNVNSFLPEQMKKAQIVAYSEDGSKKTMKVLFNPSQYTLSEEASYEQIPLPWKDDPLTVYAGGSAKTLSMELFLDTSPVLTTSTFTNEKATDVSKKVREITDLINIDGRFHAPPEVKFIWGSLSFFGVITHVESTYTKFAEDGMPIQAKLNVHFMEVVDSWSGRKSPFESPDRTKSRTVREDYSIWDMAAKEYGDISKWRIIAKANGISDPLHIAPGTVLKIPAL